MISVFNGTNWFCDKVEKQNKIPTLSKDKKKSFHVFLVAFLFLLKDALIIHHPFLFECWRNFLYHTEIFFIHSSYFFIIEMFFQHVAGGITKSLLVTFRLWNENHASQNEWSLCEINLTCPAIKTYYSDLINIVILRILTLNFSVVNVSILDFYFLWCISESMTSSKYSLYIHHLNLLSNIKAIKWFFTVTVVKR